MPPSLRGSHVLDGIEVADGERRLGKLLQASMWTFSYASSDGLAEAVAELPIEGPLTTERERKGEIVTVDVRPALVGVVAHEDSIRAVLHHPGFIPEDRTRSPDPRSARTTSTQSSDCHTNHTSRRAPHKAASPTHRAASPMPCAKPPRRSNRHLWRRTHERHPPR